MPWMAVVGLAISAYSAYQQKKQGDKAASAVGKDAARAGAPYLSDWGQSWLPPSLQQGMTGGPLDSGIWQIGELMKTPGGLGKNISRAIAPRLALESENIAGEFGNIRSQQSGQLARSNAPISIKGALASALDVAESRAQRDTRRGLMSESETLRRTDLDQTYKMLDAILQFQSSGRGQAGAGIAAAEGFRERGQAAGLAGLGSALNNPALGAAINQIGARPTTPAVSPGVIGAQPMGGNKWSI